jgi:hypothetical protein
MQHRTRHLASIAATLIGAVSVIALAAAPVAAQEVGTATAVNPMTETTPPGATTTTLTVGAHIVHKERIHTTPSGTVQLLFVDKSTMSIAPNTNITIDEFVYDPNANNGHMLVSLAQGALRFVGGKLSHQGETEIATPAAAIGIRGGTATISFGPNGAEVIDHYGVITIHNGAGTFTLFRPDFFVVIRDWNTPASEPQRVPYDKTDHYRQATSSQQGQTGGGPTVTDVQIGDCGIGALPGTFCPGPPFNPTDGGVNAANAIITQATQQGTATLSARGNRNNIPGANIPNLK